MQNNSPHRHDNDSSFHRYRDGAVGVTATTLVLRLRDGNGIAWETFDKLYVPLIRLWCRWENKRLAEPLTRDERKDITSAVVEKVLKALRKKDAAPEIRSFRGWLRTITKHCIIDQLKKRNKDKVTGRVMSDSGFIAKQADRQEEPLDFDDEPSEESEKILLFRNILKQTKSADSEILRLLLVVGKTSNEVAATMHMTAANVRKIKQRELKRIRDEYTALGLDGELPNSLLPQLDTQTLAERTT
ncbi:MAG: RNA polymerase sigma factor [Thermoguttaceae bacterium]